MLFDCPNLLLTFGPAQRVKVGERQDFFKTKIARFNWPVKGTNNTARSKAACARARILFRLAKQWDNMPSEIAYSDPKSK